MPPAYEKFFPKPSFYPNQKEAMDRIYEALSAGRLVLFEGACGTGKTLSALVPSLAIAREKNKKVIIATNVHQQMEQFIEEAREIKAIADIRVAVLKGKVHMCPMEKDFDECSLLRENTYELLELERDIFKLKERARAAVKRAREDGSFADLRQSIASEVMAEQDRAAQLKKRSCPYLMAVLKEDNASFREWLFSGVRSPDDIAAEALKKGQCGYELLKRHLKEAELIICNYHHILDADIQARLLSWMGCTLSDVILIFDEAHNLEAQARVHSSLTLSEHTVERSIMEAAASQSDSKEDLEYFLTLLLNTIRAAYSSRLGFGEAERLTQSWTDITIRDPHGGDDLLMQKLKSDLKERGIDLLEVLGEAINVGLDIDEAYEKEYKDGRSETRRRSSLLDVGKFMLFYARNSDNVDYYPVLNVRRSREGEVYGRIELYSCIPTDVTRPIMDGAYSVILMSATLKPFDMVRSTLGIVRETVELSFGTTFPPERRRTLAVDVQPQFAKDRHMPDTVKTLVGLLEDIISGSEGNVLIFFPSAAEAERYSRLIKVDVPVFLDEAGVPAQNAKNEFFKHGDKGGKAVLLTYLWGTLTEGVDYKFDRCRTVAIVGVGFPSLNDRMEAVQNAYDAKFGPGKGWEYGVLYPTIRRIRQANGRVVRSPEDYGIRILIDHRYTQQSVKDMKRYSIYAQFPEDERSEFHDIKPEKVKYSMMNFFMDIKRMDEKPKEKKAKA
ncbi:Rad3-related DNA helicase [Methanocella conradii HZ254]|uniref:Rad3-related DNA helicase n=1 Tax=Methanocella conradii (strain DSM 24694 / JCM 17849 / CGMCC 1.5162 / HZ254) TaxID=1041930 RepID=H8I9W2_METCZ|nr:ATP-dependent DNA helicase [Methanocella conradii]AFD00922.1 Rad3-related DNA helicase [Methanocella conradii HZ254]MDI6897596.1 ATP-dependent DNA helicase [Methanocella conradii]